MDAERAAQHVEPCGSSQPEAVTARHVGEEAHGEGLARAVQGQSCQSLFVVYKTDRYVPLFPTALPFRVQNRLYNPPPSHRLPTFPHTPAMTHKNPGPEQLPRSRGLPYQKNLAQYHTQYIIVIIANR
jgi:hypothetical protein